MKKFNKYRLIGLGILIILVFVFIILALCGGFRHDEHRYECATDFLYQQTEENDESNERDSLESDIWIEEPDTIPGLSNVILHRYLSSNDNGFYKLFSSKGSDKFYYNGRHGYYVLLPKEMGYLQQGENIMGAHGNEFYNKDTTLVISCEALFYDVFLDDNPHWEDSLRMEHQKWLDSKGKVKFLSRKPNEIVAKVFINRANNENPPSDFLLSKWILKKDIDNRECDMSVAIWYNDSLKYRESELLNIINKFPNYPFNN